MNKQNWIDTLLLIVIIVMLVFVLIKKGPGDPMPKIEPIDDIPFKYIERDPEDVIEYTLPVEEDLPLLEVDVPYLK